MAWRESLRPTSMQQPFDFEDHIGEMKCIRFEDSYMYKEVNERVVLYILKVH